MANHRVNTMKQEEIQRLKKAGRSQRECQKILGISRNSVRKYWHQEVVENKNPYPLWAQSLQWDEIKNEIDSGITKSILHSELSAKNDGLPDYSNFCRFYSKYIESSKKEDVTIKIHRKPGHTIEVDYSGDGFEILNPSTGQIDKVELFVGALSYSSRFYAEFTYTQKQEDFIRAQENMLHYFGGVTKYIVPDNCKTAIIKNDGYDPEVNKVYNDFCKHYELVIDPARVRHPKDKPVVERTVGIIQQTFLASIRHKTYTSLYQLNQDLRSFIDQYQHKVMKHRGHSRYELFEKEREYLRPLNNKLFELYEYKKAKVHPDCHIQLKGSFYSVPYDYVGKQIELKFNSNMIHCYFEGAVIASHSALKGTGQYSTLQEHYPSQKVVEVNFYLAHAKKKAKNIGDNVFAVVEKLIKANRHPLKNLRKIQGIIALEAKHGALVLDGACETALEYNKLSKRFIEGCAKSYRPNKDKTISQTPKRDKNLICLQGGKK